MKPFHPFVLFLMSTTAAAQGLPEFPEPNDTPSTATLFAPGLQAQGDLTAGDKDWFLFVLNAPSDLLAMTGWTVGTTTDLDTTMTLFESDGVTIVGANDDRGLDRYSRLELQSVPANTPTNPFYLLEVRHFQAGGTGSYVLDLRAKSGTPSVSETAEPNDPRLPASAATPAAIDSLHNGVLTVGSAATSFTSTTADYDFYQLNITAPVTLEFETKDSQISPATDTVIHVCDAAFTRITFDDDGGGLALSRLVFTFTIPGTYYVVVAGYGASTGVGAYQLAIRSEGPTFVEFPGGCTGSSGSPHLSVRGGGNPTELPWLGTEFYVDETILPANGIYVRLLGLSSLPAPLDLTAFGAPGCLLEINRLTSELGFADPNGTGFWRVGLPVRPGLVGVQLHYQLAVLDAGANALGLTMSNRAVATVRLQ